MLDCELLLRVEFKGWICRSGGGFFWFCWSDGFFWKDFEGEMELLWVFLLEEVCGVWGVVGVLKWLGEDWFWELRFLLR